MRSSSRTRILCALTLALDLAVLARADAQSLVVNHDFETLTSNLPGWCPSFSSEIFKAAGWQTPAMQITPDYFHACGSSPYQVPGNGVGTEPDKVLGAQAYAGIMAYNTNVDSREYVQAPFVAPLVCGVTYEVSFCVSLAELSGLAIDRFGAYLGEAITTTGFVLNQTPQISGSTLVSSTSGWTVISGTFVANGGEEFITIGNFGSAALTNWVVNPGGPFVGIAYYYIDNVMVQALSPADRAYVTTFDNKLASIDIGPTPGCDVAVIGTTEDIGTGVLRDLSGLAFDGKRLWGLTYQGDLLEVDPCTAKTKHVYSLSTPASSWHSLAYDDQGSLYTAGLNLPHPLAKISLQGPSPSDVLIGSTNVSGNPVDMTPLAFYPAAAPATPPTFDGTHPAPSILYGQGTATGSLPQPIDPATGNTTQYYPFLSEECFFDLRAFQFRPSDGHLYVVHTDNLGVGLATLSRYSFSAQSYSSWCNLPVQLGIPMYPCEDRLPARGMAFIPEVDPATKKAVKLCVTGGSTGVGWSWWLEGTMGSIAALATSATAEDIAAAFVASLRSYGFLAYVESTDPTCLNVITDLTASLMVGPFNGTPNCTITNNPSGCTVNPTITEAGFLPPLQPVASQSPPQAQLGELSATPNPFNPRTTIRFVLGAAASTRVEIFDLRGHRVRLLQDGPLPSGENLLNWSGRDDGGARVASGAYFVRIHSGSAEAALKLMLLK